MAAEGFGTSPQDVVDIFTDMADGSDFPTAFEKHMGISLTDYEKQFFDLMNDSGETEDLSETLPDLAESMLARLTRLYEESAGRSQATPEGVLDDATREKLRALGYIE